jgi:predicted negative regulator of RcsB-dependent stress response
MIIPVVLLCSNACVLWFVWKTHQQTQRRVAAAQRVHREVIKQLQQVVREIEQLRHDVQNQTGMDAVDHEADWWKKA